MAFRRWARRTCIPRFILAFIQFFILTFECVICAFICGRIIGIAFTRRCVAAVGGAFFLFYPCIAYTFIQFAIGALEFAIVADFIGGRIAFTRRCVATVGGAFFLFYPCIAYTFLEFAIGALEFAIVADFIGGRIAFTRRCVATVGGAFFLFYPCIAYTFLEFAIGALEFAIVANLRRGWASVAFPRYCIAPHCALLCRICAVFAHLAMLAITPAFPIGARRTTFVFGTTISTTSRQCYQR